MFVIKSLVTCIRYVNWFRIPGSRRHHPIPGSPLPKIMPEVTAKRMTAVRC